MRSSCSRRWRIGYTVPCCRSNTPPLSAFTSSITAYPWAGPRARAASNSMSRWPRRISPLTSAYLARLGLTANHAAVKRDGRPNLARTPRAEHAFKIEARVRGERDVGKGPRDARHLRDAPGHDVSELFVLARADHRHEVDLAGHRVHLGYAGDRGEVLADLRKGAALGGDEHDGGDHRGLETLDVDVVERGLHEMRGFLVSHRLAALQRGLVRLVGVLIRPLVVAVETLLELVDGELDAVASGAADQDGPPGACSGLRIRREGRRYLRAIALDGLLLADHDRTDGLVDDVRLFLDLGASIRGDVH